MENYYNALMICSERYENMLASYHYWCDNWTAEDQKLWMFIGDTFHCGIEDRLPLMKLNRWLGYIQANLIQRGCTTVEAERNWTRLLFRHLDFPEGTNE